MSLRPENPRAAKAATVRRKLKRAGRVARTRQGLRPLQPSVAELERLCAAIVYRRDGYKCVRCGFECKVAMPRKDGSWSHPGLAAHHVIPKGRAPILRFEIENLVTLCQLCHVYWAHKDVTEAGEFFTALLGAEKLAELRLRQAWASAHGARIDRMLMLLELQAEAKRLGVSL